MHSGNSMEYNFLASSGKPDSSYHLVTGKKKVSPSKEALKKGRAAILLTHAVSTGVCSLLTSCGIKANAASTAPLTEGHLHNGST